MEQMKFLAFTGFATDMPQEVHMLAIVVAELVAATGVGTVSALLGATGVTDSSYNQEQAKVYAHITII